MKTLFQLLILAVCCSLSPQTATAQDDRPTAYHMIDYMKVTPGMDADYIKCEQAWKKIHAAKKKAGKVDQWELSAVISPAGASTEYDYVTRNTFFGDEKLAANYETPYFPENWESLLTADELALVNRTNELRTIVKTEVWATVEAIFAADMSDATVHVWNYFDHPEGKTRDDHFKVERDIWMPVHQARINDGKLKAWLLVRAVMPTGSSMPYHDLTVDVYKDMKSMLTDPVPDYFEKVHTGKDTDEMFNQTNANTDLMMRVVLMHIDGME